MPDRTPDDVRVAVDRALARLSLEDAAEAPRQLAVTLALAEDLSAEEALSRCGLEVPTRPRGATIAFVRIPPGGLFRHHGVRYRKVVARVARRLATGAPNAYPVGGGEGRNFLPTDRVGLVAAVRRRAA
ncbi:hypothetical protein [Rubrivirga sp.]|uniref:hypothetical protein n=1 Tax=Rubrivirga sp. TaxID=1885344 RepID=UPI003C720BD6